MESIYQAIFNFSDRFGRAIRWLGLFLVISTGLVVALRYLFNWSPIALQEAMTYLHASLFMLGAAYTLNNNGHVRVDVFYQNFSKRKQLWVNLFGTLFLLFPTCIFIFVICLPYVGSSWEIMETSIEGNGLPFVYLLKTLLLIQPVLLMLQGFGEILKSVHLLRQPESVEGQ